MEREEKEVCLGEESEGETHDNESNEDDGEFCYASVPPSKLQPRKVLSKGHWISEMGMAEVEVQKGPIWRTTGIVRRGKIYCSIEEVLFLGELGAFLVTDDTGARLSMEDMYAKLSDENNGCSWEHFQAYRQLKSLGYVVARHDVPWSMKNATSNSESSFPQRFFQNVVDVKSEEMISISATFSRMRIEEVRPIFDVYSPNGKFRKSSPGDPIFVLCFSSGLPPSKTTLEILGRQCQGVPLKFCHVEQGRVSIFSFDKVDLPVLP